MNERVKLIRKQLGMTQEQLAQRLGIGKAALSMIETGKAGLSARNRNILVQELNVNPDWLETGKGNMFNAEPDLTAYMHRTDNSLPLQSVPLYSISATAVAIATLIGYLPDMFVHTMFGNWIDAYGNAGYTRIIVYGVLTAVLGALAAIFAIFQARKVANRSAAKAEI